MTYLLILISLSWMGSPETMLQQYAPEPADVEQTIIQLFDAMRENDRDSAEDVFHASATLSTVTQHDGEIALAKSDLSVFLDAIGRPKEEQWDERYSDLEIHIDGNLAAAWMSYTFYRGDRFSHCGVNAIKLIRTEEKWKIFSITDTRRTEDC